MAETKRIRNFIKTTKSSQSTSSKIRESEKIAKMEYRRILKDGFHLAAGKAGTILISLANMILLARILTTEQMGKYSLFLMIVNLALVIGLNWSDASIIRHGREEYVNRGKINKSFWARMYLFLPAVALFTITFLIFNKQITEYVGIERHLITLIILAFILQTVLNFIMYIHQSMDQMKKSAYVLLSQKIIFLICLAILIIYPSDGNLTRVLLFLNLSFLVSTVFYLATFKYDKIFPYTFSKDHLKKIWDYSWPQLLGFPGLYAINYIDLYVIKHYMSLEAVGIYNIAYNGFTSITGSLMIIYTVFMPLIVEYRTNKQSHLIASYIRKLPYFALGWTALVILGTIISKYVIPAVFSAKYEASIPSFNILLMASIFYFLSIYLLPIINAYDLIIYSQVFNLIKAIMNITGDFILVPKLGIIGAAYSTAISYATGFLLCIILIYVKRRKIFQENANEKVHREMDI